MPAPYGTLAARPAAGVAGRFYYVTDPGVEKWYQDDGAAWAPMQLVLDVIQGRLAFLTDADASGQQVPVGQLGLFYPVEFPTHSNVNDPTANQKGALNYTGIGNPPSASNQYVLDQDPRLTLREDLAAQWDVSVTLTTIGTSFVDVYTQTNSDGKSAQLDTNGLTWVRLEVLWNKIGSGTQSVQVLEVGTANVLISLDVVSGRNVSSLTAIPGFAQSAVKHYKLQAKSDNGADSPVFEGARLYLK